MAIKSLYCQPEVRVNVKQSKSFNVNVGFWQGCVLSLYRSIIYVNWMNKHSRTDEFVMMRRFKISMLFFTDD